MGRPRVLLSSSAAARSSHVLLAPERESTGSSTARLGLGHAVPYAKRPDQGWQLWKPVGGTIRFKRVLLDRVSRKPPIACQRRPKGKRTRSSLRNQPVMYRSSAWQPDLSAEPSPHCRPRHVHFLPRQPPRSAFGGHASWLPSRMLLLTRHQFGKFPNQWPAGPGPELAIRRGESGRRQQCIPPPVSPWTRIPVSPRLHDTGERHPHVRPLWLTRSGSDSRCRQLRTGSKSRPGPRSHRTLDPLDISPAHVATLQDLVIPDGGLRRRGPRRWVPSAPTIAIARSRNRPQSKATGPGPKSGRGLLLKTRLDRRDSENGIVPDGNRRRSTPGSRTEPATNGSGVMS